MAAEMVMIDQQVYGLSLVLLYIDDLSYLGIHWVGGYPMKRLNSFMKCA